MPPVYTVQYGRIRGVVWRNSGSEGEWLSVSVTRSYKDNSDPPQWKQATTFGRDDLLVVAEVTRALWAWIVRRQAGGTETSPPAPTSDGPIPFRALRERGGSSQGNSVRYHLSHLFPLALPIPIASYRESRAVRRSRLAPTIPMHGRPGQYLGV